MGENSKALGHWSLALGLNANSRTDGCISIGAGVIHRNFTFCCHRPECSC
ncbi:MAG: hypothetical protein IPH46_09565 [Bacteroidetes bacterium]|nr:hypothetical protein [Bacteroidota bacterium]